MAKKDSNKREHLGSNQVRCNLSTRYTGWYDEGKDGIEHSVTFDFSSLERKDVELIASRALAVDFQAAVKNSFSTGEAFTEWLEGEGADYTVSANLAGTQIQSREELVAEAKRNLTDEELVRILKERGLNVGSAK